MFRVNYLLCLSIGQKEVLLNYRGNKLVSSTATGGEKVNILH